MLYTLATHSTRRIQLHASWLIKYFAPSPVANIHAGDSWRHQVSILSYVFHCCNKHPYQQLISSHPTQKTDFIRLACRLIDSWTFVHSNHLSLIHTYTDQDTLCSHNCSLLQHDIVYTPMNSTLVNNICHLVLNTSLWVVLCNQCIPVDRTHWL